MQNVFRVIEMQMSTLLKGNYSKKSFKFSLLRLRFVIFIKFSFSRYILHTMNSFAAESECTFTGCCLMQRHKNPIAIVTRFVFEI